MSFALTALAHRAVTGMARFWDDVRELEARRAVLERPWDHQSLHWSGLGQETELHGRVLPRRGTVLTTGRGWCACLAQPPARKPSGRCER